MSTSRKEFEDQGLTKEQVDFVLNRLGQEVSEEKRKTEQAQNDLKESREQLDRRNTDFAELQKSLADSGDARKQLEDLQKKYDAEAQEHQKQIAARDYNDAIIKSISKYGLKFSSKAAERAFIADLKANPLELKDGELVGFEDYQKRQAEADPDAFQPVKPAPKFTAPGGQEQPPAAESKGAKYAKQFNAKYTKG